METRVDWKELLNHAIKQSRMFGRDPEYVSIAGEATVIAVRSYTQSRGLTLPQWVSFVVKTQIWTYWRSRRSRPIEYKDVEPVCEDDPITDMTPDFNILTAYYIDRQALWSLAREYKCTDCAMRKRLNAATARFINMMGA